MYLENHEVESHLVGKEILKVETTYLNQWTFIFTDGSWAIIDCIHKGNGVYGPILNIDKE